MDPFVTLDSFVCSTTGISRVTSMAAGLEKTLLILVGYLSSGVTAGV